MKLRPIILPAVCLAILVMLPMFLSPNMLAASITMMIAALFALAFTLAMGQAGMLSFGHAAYYGLGAFAAIHIMVAVEKKLFFFPTPLIPIAGGAIGFVFGLVFAVGYVLLIYDFVTLGRRVPARMAEAVAS